MNRDFILVILALWIGTTTANAENPAKPLAALDVFEIQYAMDPQISPDGKRVVYVRQFCDIMTDKRHSNLWIVNSDGGEHRTLTTGNFNDTSPRWSRDGNELIFISNRDGSPQIYRRWMDSGQTSKVTNLTAPPAGIAWSPDGKWISFTAHVPSRPKPLIEMPAAPDGAKWAEPAKVIDKLIYRFNGPGYLKPGYTHLFVVPADGGTPRQISQGDFQHSGPVVFTSEAVWTPDGKHLLMSANRRANYESDPLNTEIYDFNIEDGTVKTLTSRAGPDDAPAVSPDGTKIAYVGFDDKFQGYQVRKLHVCDRDGSNARVLTDSLDRDVQNPRWAPDGSGIYFLSADRGNTGLHFIDLKTESATVAKASANVGSGGSAYGVGTAFSLANNGAFAVTYTRPDVPGDIAVGQDRKSRTKVITAVNQGLLSSRKLGQVSELSYKSSKDNRDIHGWLITPPGFDPTKKYPMILEIHGGPFANYGDRFDLEKQLMAAKGYVVLYTNPRGSTSYGGEFGNLIHHAYPGDDLHDLLSGVDAVVTKGYIAIRSNSMSPAAAAAAC